MTYNYAAAEIKIFKNMEGGHWCPLYYHLLRKKVECLSEIHIKL